MTVTHNGKWNVWSQRWPIMTESFLVRFVWARPKNWRSPRAATWKSDFTASSGIGKFSLMCIPISCPLLEFLLGSFMSCHCIFKTACLKKSQCVTSRVTGERKVAECGRWKRVCVDEDLIAVSGLKRKQNHFAWDQTRSHVTGSWSVHLHYIHYPLAPPHRVRAHVTQCWPKSLMQSLWEPLSVDRHQTGLTTAHLLPWHNTY